MSQNKLHEPTANVRVHGAKDDRLRHKTIDLIEPDEQFVRPATPLLSLTISEVEEIRDRQIERDVRQRLEDSKQIDREQGVKSPPSEELCPDCGVWLRWSSHALFCQLNKGENLENDSSNNPESVPVSDED